MDRKVKVMQIMPEFGLAGAEIMAENLSVSLLSSGYDVKVVSLYTYHSAITERLEKLNIPIFYLGKKKGFDFKIIFRLYKLFKKEKPDIIHTHRYLLPYAMIASFFAKVPVKVHTIHNIATKEIGRFQRKLNKLFYRFFNVIPIAISPLVKTSVIKEYGLSSDKVPMIYNGIDVNKCIPKKEYGVQPDRIEILHIGRFAEQKNHISLIESFKIAHDKEPTMVLKLIGSGELEELIKQKVIDLGLVDSVSFLGLQSDVHQHLNSADIFILPSLWEGMPITIIEAMATGLPIIAANVGGIPDMIENKKSGMLITTEINDISSALLLLIRNAELCETLGVNAKNRSLLFTATNMKNEYENVYVKALEN